MRGGVFWKTLSGEMPKAGIFYYRMYYLNFFQNSDVLPAFLQNHHQISGSIASSVQGDVLIYSILLHGVMYLYQI